MTKRFIATVAAASLGLALVTAAPARALDGGETARLLLGAGAAIMLGSALQREHDRKNERRVVVNRQYPPQPYYGNNGYNARNNAVVVPERCVNRHGNRVWIDQGCMKRHGY